MEVVHSTKDLSGRALRKLPFTSHAFFVRRSLPSLQEFMFALQQGAQRELKARAQMAMA